MSHKIEIHSENDQYFKNRFHIPVELLYQDFENHLQLENNLRIFFSSIYGSGKTYFLTEFFKKNESKYKVIKVYPVCYSTATNRDVFELIKFDILFQIVARYGYVIDQDPEVQDFILKEFFLIDYFKKNTTNLLEEIVNVSTEIAVANPILKTCITKLVSLLSGTKTKYEEFKKEFSQNSAIELSEFMQSVLNKYPEYSFEDPIGKIICKLIERLRMSDNGNNIVVLLIDDMDRLDPDHLFRILNIFGNHFGDSNVSQFFKYENKFGFDKIITVGDIKNIKSIFSHRYGASSDFNGYFSKYYSKGIYDYSSILKFDSEFCGRFLPELHIDEASYLRNCDKSLKINLEVLRQKLNQTKDVILTSILCSILQKQQLTIRQLMSYVDVEVINVSIAPRDKDVIGELSLYFYYLVRYLEVLFRGNLKVFETVPLEDVPFCLKQLYHDSTFHSSIVCSAVLLSTFRSSSEFQKKYLSGKLDRQEISFHYLVGREEDNAWRRNPTAINDNRDELGKWTIHNPALFPLGNVNLWDLIRNSFKNPN